ncbi:MAG: class I mannose-6-phosphate isomerase [Planctomycetota bacterium]|jgi:mannose-6-phosphate isomerase|nr:class I mannose-6-phosphate isomerase [Planctomycetota bacterium]
MERARVVARDGIAMYAPIFFESIAKRRSWGGSRLVDRFGGEVDPPIGESWELSGLPGKASLATNFRYAGRTLEDLYDEDPVGIAGQGTAAKYSRFPLMVKLIDTGDDLPVQVSPNTGYAQYRFGPDALGKMEFWYILDADPKARIFYGFSKFMSQEEVSVAALNGNLGDSLHSVGARAGVWAPIQPGVVNAVGKGVFLVSVQQASEYAFRLFDWNRMPKKELNLKDALLCANLNKFADTPVCKTVRQSTPKTLVDNQVFSIRKWDLEPGNAVVTPNAGKTFFIVFPLDTAMAVSSGGQRADCPARHACLVPAGAGEFEMAVDAPGSALVVSTGS